VLTGAHAVVSPLARPQAANAQDYRMLTELNQAFDRAARDETVRVIVLAADGNHFAVFEHAQELCLRGRGQVGDLVEKQRAAIRERELAAPRFVGAGERTAHVAEELALEQRVGHRRAVHRDERGALACR